MAREAASKNFQWGFAGLISWLQLGLLQSRAFKWTVCAQERRLLKHTPLQAITVNHLNSSNSSRTHTIPHQTGNMHISVVLTLFFATSAFSFPTEQKKSVVVRTAPATLLEIWAVSWTSLDRKTTTDPKNQ